MKIKSALIASLNDELRKDPSNRGPGLITMTSGVAALGSAFWAKVADKLASLMPADFDSGNDPYGERDFAAIEVDGEKLFFKIDYFAKGSEYMSGAETPEDPATTDRVLTVMLREEY